ncbi:hypothetical protein J6P68_03190 [bacterium]|nr:hypothetical protein [bacterium]
MNSSSINNVYKFSITYENIKNTPDINAIVTYKLINNETNQEVLLNQYTSSLNESYGIFINFNNLKDFTNGTYTLSATISVLTSNNNSFSYLSNEVQSLTITYNPTPE